MLKKDGSGNVFATEWLYLDATQTEVVKRGNPKAAFLLAAEGAQIPDVWVVRLGLNAVAETVKGTEPKRRSTRPATPDATR